MSDTKRPVIGIIGGTGDLGSGLAKGWAAALQRRHRLPKPRQGRKPGGGAWERRPGRGQRGRRACGRHRGPGRSVLPTMRRPSRRSGAPCRARSSSTPRFRWCHPKFRQCSFLRLAPLRRSRSACWARGFASSPPSQCRRRKAAQGRSRRVRRARLQRRQGSARPSDRTGRRGSDQEVSAVGR